MEQIYNKNKTNSQRVDSKSEQRLLQRKDAHDQ